MVEIKKGICAASGRKRLNSRERRKIARSRAHHEKLRQEKSLSVAIEEAINGCSIRTLNAINGTAPRDDMVMPAEPKDDAIHHAVNHAHQRNPKKRWS